MQAQETIQLLGGKNTPWGDTAPSKQKSEDLNSGSFGIKKKIHFRQSHYTALAVLKLYTLSWPGTYLCLVSSRHWE